MPLPARADARHNRARVLAAALAAFAEEGLSVSLDTVARRAGVGAGTVYRHFPSKDALFAAVVNDRLDHLTTHLTDLTTHLTAQSAAAPTATASGPAGDSARTSTGGTGSDPGSAFFTAFEHAVNQVALNKALCESMTSAAIALISPDARARLMTALTPLLTRAQEAGAVRPDVTPADVMSLIAGCATMENASPAPGRGTAIVMDGLRPAPSPVTKPNETSCAECGNQIPATPTGRPARYCGNACRQRAHRRRHAS